MVHTSTGLHIRSGLLVEPTSFQKSGYWHAFEATNFAAKVKSQCTVYYERGDKIIPRGGQIRHLNILINNGPRWWHKAKNGKKYNFLRISYQEKTRGYFPEIFEKNLIYYEKGDEMYGDNNVSRLMYCLKVRVQQTHV
jgi:hypothetical protein